MVTGRKDGDGEEEDDDERRGLARFGKVLTRIFSNGASFGKCGTPMVYRLRNANISWAFIGPLFKTQHKKY